MNVTTEPRAKESRNRSADDQASSDRDERISQAIGEFLAAIEAGNADRSALLINYKDVADELTGCLEALDFMNAVAPQLGHSSIDAKAGGSTPISPLATLGDFRILREIGRGGMGVVYEAEQLSIGRRVALKVLPFAAMLDRQQLNRFKNEARAAGTLNHPNIVAIHSVGVERGVHYYAMQLIEGQSLAQVVEQVRKKSSSGVEQQRSSGVEVQSINYSTTPLLHSRSSEHDSTTALPLCRSTALSAADTSPIAALSTIPDFDSREYFRAIAQLGIQAAEALDHAHQNGILHRDIKPANLLVDDTGKLWITDFGLARIEHDAGMTMTGDILGTLRYMSPEQALAKRVVVDHRSDIYSLGVTLYELHTLQPAYGAQDRQELLRQIAFEDPRKPRQINARIPQDCETIILKAIEKNPADRYTTAREMADDMRRFLEDEPIKAKPQSVFATMRKWSRRHQSMVWAFMVTLLVSGLALAGSIGWVYRDRAARQTVADATASLAIDETTRLIEQSKWPEALAAVSRADDVLTVGAYGGFWRARAHSLRKDIEMVLRLEEIRFNPDSPSIGEPTYDSPSGVVILNSAETGRKYAQAFRDYGIDVDAIDPTETAACIRDRSVRLELALALDRWALWQRLEKKSGWERLIAVARAADPNPLHNRLRDVLDLPDDDHKSALIALAKSIGSESFDKHTAVSLAVMLDNVGAYREAIDGLRAAQQHYPNDYYVNFRLAAAVEQAEPPNLDDAIRFYSAAIALRPESALAHNNLGHMLAEKGLRDEAIAHFNEAIRLQPGFAGAHRNLGDAFMESGLLEQAIDCQKEAIRLEPNYAPAYSKLGIALSKKGLLDKAIASFKEAIRLKPDYVEGYINLGVALGMDGQLDEAIACHKELVRLQPDSADAHRRLGDAFAEKGLLDEAIASNREAIRLKPDYADAYVDLGAVQFRKGLQDEAITSWKEALRLKPDNELVLVNLGGALIGKGKLDEAIAHCQEAIRINSNSASAHNNLGCAYFYKGLMNEALASFREAIRLKPDYTDARKSIGQTLLKLGESDEGLDSYKQAIRAYRQRRDDHKAKAAFDEAVELLEKNQTAAEVVDHFRAEVNDLLEQKITPTNSTTDD